MGSDTLKPGWTRVAFGDVVRLSATRAPDPEAAGFARYVGLEHLDPGDLTIRRWGDVAAGTTFTSVFRPGHVLFGKRRAYQRKVAVPDFGGVCSGDIYVFESTNEHHLLPDLLPFICQTDGFFEHAIGTSAGSLSPRTNWKSLAAYEFALPPLDEQRQIVEALQAIGQVSATLFNLLTSMRVAQSAIFESKLNSRNATATSLGDLLLRSPQNGCSAPLTSDPTGHWVLALSAISRWGYVPGQLKPVEGSPAMKAALIDCGDLVVSRSNTRDLVGLPAVFSEARKDVSYPDTMMRLSFDQAAIDPLFIEQCLRTPNCRRQIQSYAAGTSASMKKINGTNLRKITVPLVSLELQREALSELDGIRRLLLGTESRVAYVNSVKSCMLETIFSIARDNR